MTIYLTSDWHFNHNKDFIYKPRFFDSIQEMNESIIKRHNATVSAHDIVYVLGDLCLGGSDESILKENKKMISSLNGQLKVILGNHDTTKRIQMYNECPNIEVIGYADMLTYDKHHFYLSHYPSFTSNLDDDKSLKQRVINLFGHTHSYKLFFEGNHTMVNVAADAWNCYPTSIDMILETIYTRENFLREQNNE